MRSSSFFLSCLYLSLTITAPSPSPKALPRDLPAHDPNNPVLQPRGICLSCLEPHRGAGNTVPSLGKPDRFSPHRRPSIDRESPDRNLPEVAGRTSSEGSAGSGKRLGRLGQAPVHSLPPEDAGKSSGEYSTGLGQPGQIGQPPREGFQQVEAIGPSSPQKRPSLGRVSFSPSSRDTPGRGDSSAGPSSPLGHASRDRMGMGRNSGELSVAVATIGNSPVTPPFGRDSLGSGSINRAASRNLQPSFEAVSSKNPSTASPRGGSVPLSPVDSPSSGDFIAERWARIQARKGQASPRVMGGSEGGTPPRSPPPGSNRQVEAHRLDIAPSGSEAGSPRGDINSPPPISRRPGYPGQTPPSSPESSGSRPSLSAERWARRRAKIAQATSQAAPGGSGAVSGAGGSSDQGSRHLRSQSAGSSSRSRSPSPPPGPESPPRAYPPDPRPLERRAAPPLPGLGASKQKAPENSTPPLCRGSMKRSCKLKCYCVGLHMRCDLPSRKSAKSLPHAPEIVALLTKESCAPSCLCVFQGLRRAATMTPEESTPLREYRDAAAAAEGGSGIVAGARRSLSPGSRNPDDVTSLVPRAAAPVPGLGGSKVFPPPSTRPICSGDVKRTCERKCYCETLTLHCDIPSRQTSTLNRQARRFAFVKQKESCAPACRCEFQAMQREGFLTADEQWVLNQDRPSAGTAGPSGGREVAAARGFLSRQPAPNVKPAPEIKPVPEIKPAPGMNSAPEIEPAPSEHPTSSSSLRPRSLVPVAGLIPSKAHAKGAHQEGRAERTGSRAM